MVDDTFNPPSSIQRMEIRTGIGHRRRFSSNEKGRIVAESFAPGVTVSEVARRHGMTPQHLFKWRQEARNGRLVLPSDIDASFATVVVDERVSGLSAIPAARIEIEVSGVVIRVSSGVDLRLLSDVVRALRASA
jgi:transposase